MVGRLALAGAGVSLVAGFCAGLAPARGAWNQFPSRDLIGLRATITFTAPAGPTVSTRCPALTGFQATPGSYVVTEQSSPSGWAFPPPSTTALSVPGWLEARWITAVDVGRTERVAYASSSLPIAPPASSDTPQDAGWYLSFSTSPEECRDSSPFAISAVGSPVGIGYPVLWRLGWGVRATGGLGCGFVNVTTATSASGTTVTETVQLTDAVVSQYTSYQQLACSSGRVVPATSDPAQTGADLNPQATVAKVVGQWRSELARTVAKTATKVATGSARAALLASLQQGGRLFRFQVVSTQMLQGRQLAPLVVVKTADRAGFVASVRQVLALVNPTTGTGARATRAYPAFFFEVVDANGTPFLATFNWKSGGGQWSADGHLPFPTA